MVVMAAHAAPLTSTTGRPSHLFPAKKTSRNKNNNIVTEVQNRRNLQDQEENLHNTFVSYIQALTDPSVINKPIPFVWMEHSYARARSGGSGGGRAGTRLLLVRQPPRCPDCHTQRSHDDEFVDVDTIENEPPPPLMLDEIPYWEKALVECDMLPEDEDLKPDWEEKLHSLAWNASQTSLLDEALKIIHNTRAGLLTAGHAGARRAAARGGGARAFRALLATPQTRWQPCFAQWLHNALTEYLPTPLLACYREIMLTMKSKVPVLVWKMTTDHPLTGRIQGAENGATGPTIASASIQSDPTAPLLVLIPSGRDRRDARWAERLRAVAQVHIIHSHQSSWLPSLPLTMCLTQLMNSAKARTEILKADNANRPIVLVGCGAGAAIAAQLAVTVQGIAGLICLALPLLTSDGPRGGPDDCLLDLSCPVLFVIGQNASQSSQQDAEALRSKLKVKSRLLVCGGADELLRLPRLKRQLEGVTQRMLECAIADEVSSFLKFMLQKDGDVEPCSSPESYGGLDGDGEHFNTNTSLLHFPKRDGSLCTNRRPSSPTMHESRRKKIRHKPPIKTMVPIKNRNTTLYDLNNPTSEATTMSVEDIHNSQIRFDSKTSTQPPPSIKRTEPTSIIQITNSRVRTVMTGNGAYDSISKGSAIKVLENVTYKPPNIITTTSSTTTTPTGTLKTGLNIVLQQKLVNVDDQISNSFSAANIMDLPIVFADDNKAIENETKPTANQSTVKTIIINKPQIIPGTSNSTILDVNQKTLPSSSQATASKNIVQVKLTPPNSLNSPIVGTTVQTINKPNLSNVVKYTKVILAKRSSTDSSKGFNDKPIDVIKSQIISKPIIVKGKASPLTTFKVLPSNIFQKGSNVFTPKQHLIIKRAVVPSGLNVASVTKNETKKFTENKVDGESLRKNSTNESAIQAAVASITGENYQNDELENFEFDN